jgi:hypothetical protein
LKPPPLLLREGFVGREGRHFPFHDPSPYGAAMRDVFRHAAGWLSASTTSCRAGATQAHAAMDATRTFQTGGTGDALTPRESQTNPPSLCASDFTGDT